MQDLLEQLRRDFPDLTFTPAASCCWSPKDRKILYRDTNKIINAWSLLHEVGHAVLEHAAYESDFELIKLESAAWQKAEELAKKYNLTIDPDHIQDCLDTYRDWLHRRSTCPTCGTRSLQKSSNSYQCFNCACQWKVTASRFCRPYRRLQSKNKKSPTELRQVTFR